MSPILYDKYETDFTHLGLGKLNAAISCVVVEELNGIFDLVGIKDFCRRFGQKGTKVDRTSKKNFFKVSYQKASILD